jgi:hypothetical protein
MVLSELALVSLSPHRFVRLSCWYYQLYKIEKKSQVWIVSRGIMSIVNFTKIWRAVVEVNMRTQLALHTSILCTSPIVRSDQTLERNNMDRGYLRVKSWVEYLDLEETKEQGTSGNCKYNKEICSLTQPNIIKVFKSNRYEAHMEETRL